MDTELALVMIHPTSNEICLYHLNSKLDDLDQCPVIVDEHYPRHLSAEDYIGQLKQGMAMVERNLQQIWFVQAITIPKNTIAIIRLESIPLKAPSIYDPPATIKRFMESSMPIINTITEISELKQIFPHVPNYYLLYFINYGYIANINNWERLYTESTNLELYYIQ